MIDPELEGRVVLVTGGAGGIGAAISRAFAEQGARVAIHFLAADAVTPENVNWAHRTPDSHLANRLASGLDGAIAVEADLSLPNAPTLLFDAVTEQLGPVDVLVNNAAHCEVPDSIGQLRFEGLERTFRVNTFAPALLTAEMARRHQPHREASIINISTDAARVFPGQLAYGSSKGAVEAFTRGVALDLAASGIRVNAVAPGPVQTGWITQEMLGEVESIVPMGRVGTPEDIAEAVVFLASAQASWVTGQILQVAGGHAL